MLRYRCNVGGDKGIETVQVVYNELSLMQRGYSWHKRGGSLNIPGFNSGITRSLTGLFTGFYTLYNLVPELGPSIGATSHLIMGYGMDIQTQQ